MCQSSNSSLLWSSSVKVEAWRHLASRSRASYTDTSISILLASCCHLNLHDVYGMLSTQSLQLGHLLSTTR